MELSFETRTVRLADFENKAGSFYSSTNGRSEFGLFMHEYLTAAFPGGLPETASAPTGEGWKARLDRHTNELARRLHTLSPDQRVTQVLRSEVLYHELRHFHDAFATWWGLHLFTQYVRLMQQFVVLLAELRRLGQCSLPLSSWSDQPEAPQVVKKFVRSHRAFQLEQRIARCAFGLPWQPGPTPQSDFVVLQVEDLGVEVPAFAAVADRVVVEEGKVVSTTRGHKIIPIGLEVILEGIARQIQNHRIVRLYGMDTLDLIEHQLRTHMVLNTLEAADVETLPYGITDFMYTKILGRRGFTRGDFAGSLLAISDYALMPYDTEFDNALATGAAERSVHPGWRFIEALQRAQLLDHPPRLAVATPPAAAWCGAMREHWETVFSTDAPKGFPDFIEWCAFHQFVIPLLRIREEMGDRAFIDPGVYVALQPKLPKPDFVLVDGGLVRLSDDNAHSNRSWVAWVILDQVMLDMLDSEVVYCARHDRSKLHPYVRGLSFNAQPLDCRIELPKGCGWFGFDGELSHLPKCEFRRFVEGVALDSLDVRALNTSSDEG